MELHIHFEEAITVTGDVKAMERTAGEPQSIFME